MSLKLVLAEKSGPWDTVYRTEDGEPLYRAERTEYNYSIATSKVAIYKIRGGRDVKLDAHTRATAFGLEHTELASLRIRYAHSDELTIHGITKKEDEVFKKPFGLNWYGRDRIWVGPDGQEYRWEMGLSKPELYVNDKKNGTLVAKFHREHSGFMGIHDKSQASLEIYGQVSEPLLDMILVTFVYMETIRAQRERSTAASGAASAQATAINTVIVAT
ncbi:hypothetical protein BKA70DRAFT_1157550 [Coprinopsis sp. MPI-PUGE-AT-0042]|nr:hypothetical protein BKA70DRAFT_1157550 [Coprinopsis sp. MPI-PUGE-AT-0042]